MKQNYLTAVPVMNLQFADSDRTSYLEKCRTLGVQRVFLALGEGCLLNGKKDDELRALRENCAVLHAAGLEAGAWLWALMVPEGTDYIKMNSPTGAVSARQVCPTDARYRALMGGFLQELAACGVDLIMFDDDFRCGFHDYGFGCCCKNHRATMEKTLGAPVTDDALKKALLSGGKSPLRDAFLQANAEAFEGFAAEMRRFLDRSAPKTRLGFCACITSWDMDGTTPDRISRLLAGSTRPFYRLIGAPYWAAMRAWGNRLGDVIEFSRAEAARRTDAETEIFAEGDTYPRPRFATPASYLECFDTALRAAGCTDGVLKYIFDYTAGDSYETGYYEMSRRNLPAYAAIDAFFAGKTAAGVRVYDNAAKYRTQAVPPRLESSADIQQVDFSATCRFAAANSLPTVYEGTGAVGLAFGEDARDLPPEALTKGLITDLDGALLLQAAGTDVGLASVGDEFGVGTERFPAYGEQVGIGGVRARRLTLRPGARAISQTSDADGGAPLSYTYENDRGGRFLVFAFSAYLADQTWFRGYCRAKELRAFIKYCGGTLPADCEGHPGLYVLAKTDGNRTAAGLWNLFPDPVYAPEVRFPSQVKSVRTERCTAEIRGDTLVLSDVAPFDFALLEAETECN